MKKTLGIDLGSNSLGWAILDDLTGDILDKGVLVFPEGVDPDAGTSVETPAAQRRAARMGRRLKFRRKLRKWNLLKLLIENGMCPLSIAELEGWKKDGVYPVANKEFISWLKSTDSSNPYCDRAAAADGKVTPYTLGRALYHIAQRRGFKSSRKEEASLIDEETGAPKKADKVLGAVKSGIAVLSEKIEKSGCNTLGQYFFKRLNEEKGQVAKTRIRGVYTGRIEHYIVEFNAIMDVQGYSADDRLRMDLYNAIFMQRPLRSQKHLVGKCPLEPKNARAMIGHPAFEEFRMLSFVNNLSLEDENGEYKDEFGNLLYPLTEADRKIVCAEFLKSASSIKFSSISKRFSKDPRFRERKLRFHYYRDDDSVPTCQTRHRIKSAFGDVPYDEQKVFDALTFFDDTEKLCGWFRRHFPALEEKSVLKLASIHPKEGNAKYSLKAINKMLPFLRKGMELSQARFFAKLPDLIPDFSEHEDEIVMHFNEIIWQYRKDRKEYGELDGAVRKITPQPTSLEERKRSYFLSRWMTEEKWECLYLKDDSAYVPETEYKNKGETVKLNKPRLPPVSLGMIRNPLVQRSMTTLRRLVNYLGDHGKIDFTDTIRVELARSVNDFATRKAWQNWQEARRKIRDEARIEIEKLGVYVSEDAIDRYVLWKEQNGICMYTGRNILVSELFVGNSFDVEHTIPRSLSGDDSLSNKTVCDARYNREVKKGQVPRACPNWDQINILLAGWRDKVEQLERTYRSQLKSVSSKTEPAARSQARVKALTTRFELDYWRDKVRSFDADPQKMGRSENGFMGFKKRQLVDTGIMCSHAVEFLKCLYPATYAVNGTATAFARKAWGIQGDEAKDRSEHTHHAKDAMVIAALTPSRFTAICTALKDDGVERGRECSICPKPYPDFAEKVRKACDEILVKHILRQTTLRQSFKHNVLAYPHREKGNPNGRMIRCVKSQGDTVRGQLHLDTFYGCITDPLSNEQRKVVRKSIVGPVKDAVAIVEKIVDPAIKDIVKTTVAKLVEQGVKNIDSGCIKMPSGVPVNKVRIYATNATNAQMLRNHAMESKHEYKNPYYVTSAPGSNFRLALFEENGKTYVVPDNSLSWAQNHKKEDYVSLDKKLGFIGYVMPGTMALAHREGCPEELEKLTQAELRKRLYKVVKFREDGRVTLRHHLEARASTVLEKYLKEEGFNAKGESKINLDNPFLLLILSSKTYLSQMLFEGIHFKMLLDGSIEFMKR